MFLDSSHLVHFGANVWPVMTFELTLQHVAVSAVTNSENMRWYFSSSLALVHVDDSGSVDRVSLVRIDGHTEEARVGLKTNDC